MKNEKKLIYFLMCLVVVIWGLGFVIVKQTLELLEPLSLLFFRYLFAFVLVFIIKLKKDRGIVIRKKDILVYIVCSIVGDIFYSYCEYTALSYLPVALLSILITFAPAVSVAFERVLYKKCASAKTILGVIVCILGVVLIIGVDLDILMEGRLLGYLLAFGCIVSWNVYNFITAKLHKDYSTVSLTFNQLLCTLLLLAPYMIHSIPDLPEFTFGLTMQLIYLGVISGGVGFLVQVRALHVIGPTPTVLFMNFLPITTTFFGWLILRETITIVQMIGGAIVLSAGYVVIKEKDK